MPEFEVCDELYPQEVIGFCSRYEFCRGCPISQCVAPIVQSDFEDWLKDKIKEIFDYIDSESKM